MPDLEVAEALRTLARHGNSPVKEFADILNQIFKEPYYIENVGMYIKCKHCMAEYLHPLDFGFDPKQHNYVRHFKNCIYKRAQKLLGEAGYA